MTAVPTATAGNGSPFSRFSRCASTSSTVRLNKSSPRGTRTSGHQLRREHRRLFHSLLVACNSESWRTGSTSFGPIFTLTARQPKGYAHAYRRGERVSTAHVESTVNQLINWRMSKKKQMAWSRRGAQYLLHVKTAVLNGRLERYTGNRSGLKAIAA